MHVHQSFASKYASILSALDLMQSHRFPAYAGDDDDPALGLFLDYELTHDVFPFLVEAASAASDDA